MYLGDTILHLAPISVHIVLQFKIFLLVFILDDYLTMTVDPWLTRYYGAMPCMTCSVHEGLVL